MERLSLLLAYEKPRSCLSNTTKRFLTHPGIDIFTCTIDDHLNKNADIVPGLGDDADRIFNTL